MVNLRTHYVRRSSPAAVASPILRAAQGAAGRREPGLVELGMRLAPAQDLLGALTRRSLMTRGISGHKDRVERLQVALGLEDVDGKFGPGTEKAVKAWQTSHGMADDGVVTPLMLS